MNTYMYEMNNINLLFKIGILIIIAMGLYYIARFCLKMYYKKEFLDDMTVVLCNKDFSKLQSLQEYCYAISYINDLENEYGSWILRMMMIDNTYDKAFASLKNSEKYIYFKREQSIKNKDGFFIEYSVWNIEKSISKIIVVDIHNNIIKW